MTETVEKPIKQCAAIARSCGFPVVGGVNGGGWRRLAVAIGGAEMTKGEARHFVVNALLPPKQ